ncbi:DUF262 domain-containing protein [Cyanothece sp. BG0011]|uniref:DUF262 domain-containing protein n=1 Tax=Cyanothece sp. BG0011 TaxID=2082950 RepID=UPI000D1DB61C|nr:DUF262 domain-containing protein [Cyanothece sp. BG0011]
MTSENLNEQLRQVRVIQRTINRSVRDLITDFQNTTIMIPKYQRSFVWDIAKQCRFIESIFINIPIPAVFLLEKYDAERETNIFEIIDGVQRIRTIANFVTGILKLSNLETLPDLNQATFSSLPPQIASIFWERQLNTIIIESGTHPEIQFEVFGRLNQGSVSLNAQELRNCMFHGEFNDFLIECSHLPEYRDILKPFPKFRSPKEGKPDKNRMLDVELILRFFTLYEMYRKDTNKYPEVRTETLNQYMRQRIEASENYRSQEELKELLNKAIIIIQKVFQENHFKNFRVSKTKSDAKFGKSLNQAIFDVQMLSFLDYEIQDIEDNEEIIYEEFLRLCSYDRDFQTSVSASTSTTINERIGIWKNVLDLVIQQPEVYKHNLELKKDKFYNSEDESPTCHCCQETIKSFEESDLVDEKLYHRWCSPNLEETKIIKRKSINSSVTMELNDNNFECDDATEAYQILIDYIREYIQYDEYQVERFSSLDFVGSISKLSKNSSQRNKKFKKFIETDSTLYIDISGGRNDILNRMQEIVSMVSFIENFKVM